MKKILFFFGNYCGPSSKGGTEVATYRIAKALKDSGECIIYHTFHNSNGFPDDNIYEATEILPKNPKALIEKLAKFIREKGIDDVVVMGRFFKFDKIYKAAELSGVQPKIFFMQHFAPGSEKKKTTYASSWHLYKLNPKRMRYLLRTLFYPLLKMPRTLSWGKVYRQVYEKSDKVVLLSEGYKDDYCKVAGIKNREKFVAIPNIFDLPKDSKNDVSRKEKRVLILSRMDEIQKRLSLALRIWKKIEEDPEFEDWQLDIVGEGNNTDIVRLLIRRLGLKRATMYGWQPREKFLERSSILMMTSQYEGLPLSILEAQAYGCVPIAFDSFASLRDVISPYETGVIVDKFADLEDYTIKLKDLMRDKDYREDLAKTNPENMKKFSSEKIAEEWLKIL